MGIIFYVGIDLVIYEILKFKFWYFFLLEIGMWYICVENLFFFINIEINVDYCFFWYFLLVIYFNICGYIVFCKFGILGIFGNESNNILYGVNLMISLVLLLF